MFASDLIHPNATLQNKLHVLYGLSGGQKIDLSFRHPYLNLLEKFGNPHLSLPPVIHVAGTNGKGSTIAMMRSILKAAGKRVHVYTSPHLLRFNERIVLAGKEIDDGFLEELIDEALAYNGDQPITFFEITTAIAFAAFSRINADIALLEVGMGGRLDCTNVIPQPAVSVITPISMDHTEFLGNTLEKIASEKAGIMKSGVPCIVGMQDYAALSVIKNYAQEIGTPLSICGEFNHRYSRPRLLGQHQLHNAAVAIAAVKIWDQNIQDDYIAAGLENVTWPGRLQDVSAHLSEAADKGWEIWYDGGHNQAAGQALAEQLHTWHKQDGKDCYLFVGMMGHKEPEEFLKPILRKAKSLTIVPIQGEEDYFCLDDIRPFLSSGICANDHSSIKKAVKAITDHYSPGRILVTGSLYLAQEILNPLL